MEKILAAGERNQRDSDRDFEDAVEAVRLGTYFLHKPDAWSRWRTGLRSRTATPTKAASARGLEQQVLHLALRAPRLVALPGQEARRMRAADVATRKIAKPRRKAKP